MIAALALRAACCDWHASTHGAEEHVACVSCDRPMPLVRRAFPEIGAPPEPICAPCSLSIWISIRRHLARPRFLRRAPVARRAACEEECCQP
jgi:hypothetical protein